MTSVVSELLPAVIIIWLSGLAIVLIGLPIVLAFRLFDVLVRALR